MVDRAACGIIATKGTPLYKEDLAKDIHEHFRDILESLAPPDDADDDDEDAEALCSVV